MCAYEKTKSEFMRFIMTQHKCISISKVFDRKITYNIYKVLRRKYNFSLTTFSRTPVAIDYNNFIRKVS